MSEETPTTAHKLSYLRSETGLGVLECKNALEKANGDVSTALKRLKTSKVAAISTKNSELKNESDLNAASAISSLDLQKRIKLLEQDVNQLKKVYNDLIKTLEKRDKEILEAINKNFSRPTVTRTTYSYFPFGDFGN